MNYVFLTSTAHLRINLLAASLHIAGTVRIHRISFLLIILLSVFFLRCNWKWSANAFIERVKMVIAENVLPAISSNFKSSLIPYIKKEFDFQKDIQL